MVALGRHHRRGPKTLVGGALAFDTFAMFVTIAICAGARCSSRSSHDYLRREGLDGPELYGLFLVAAAGGVVMGAANDLIVLFLGLETLSLAFYVLAASNRRKAAEPESGMKYFMLGGFSSAFFLYGIALLYGATGTTNISKIVAAFDNTFPLERNDALVLAGVALLIVGLGFKVAAVPFHVWTPDVYEGAPTPITGVHGVGRQGRRVRRAAAGARRRACLLPRRLAAGDLGARRAVARRRLGPRRRADQREADARVLVDQPRRVHPRRRRGGRPPRRRGGQRAGVPPCWCTCSPTPCSSSARSPSSPSSPAAATARPTSPRSAASASAARRSRWR